MHGANILKHIWFSPSCLHVLVYLHTYILHTNTPILTHNCAYLTDQVQLDAKKFSYQIETFRCLLHVNFKPQGLKMNANDNLHICVMAIEMIFQNLFKLYCSQTKVLNDYYIWKEIPFGYNDLVSVVNYNL